jgi:tryptophanase
MLLEKQQKDLERIKEESQVKEIAQNKKLAKAMQRLCGWQQKTWDSFGGNVNLTIRGLDKENKIIDELNFTFFLDGGKIDENNRIIGGRLKSYKIKDIKEIEKKALSVFEYGHLYA